MQDTPPIRKHLRGSRVVPHCKAFFMVAAQRTFCYLGGTWGQLGYSQLGFRANVGLCTLGLELCVPPIH